MGVGLIWLGFDLCVVCLISWWWFVIDTCGLYFPLCLGCLVLLSFAVRYVFVGCELLGLFVVLGFILLRVCGGFDCFFPVPGVFVVYGFALLCVLFGCVICVCVWVIILSCYFVL